MNLSDIGRCWSCVVDPCPTPKVKKLHPEIGCPKWNDGKTILSHDGTMFCEHGLDIRNPLNYRSIKSVMNNPELIEVTKIGPRVSSGKGKSKQDYQTPLDFIRAVERKFGNLSWDLAASKDNAKAISYFTEHTNSLTQPWHEITGPLWLNPPFGVIGPWAKKCAEESALGAKILLLTPASVGSNWFADYVHDKALVLFLSPRLSFDGKDPYPKDLILSCYNTGREGYEPWRWNEMKPWVERPTPVNQ